MVYLQESKVYLEINYSNLVSFSQAINGDNADKWLDAMKDMLKSMEYNDV